MAASSTGTKPNGATRPARCTFTLMSLLKNIETRIASLVEGAFGRAFKTNVQPIELARRLVKEMDEHQHVSVRKVFVPNVYEIYLSPDDHEQFADYEMALRNELGEYLAEHARRSGYSLLTRPRVELHVDEDLELGSFGIATRLQQPEDSPGAAAPPPGVPAGSEPTPTMIYKPPTPLVAEAAEPPPATQRFCLQTPEGTVPLDAERLTIGRGRTNDVQLHDSSVSREHAEIVRSGSVYEIRDAGSTNGILINGAKVRSGILKAGDTIMLGNSELRFERAGTGGPR